MSGPETHEAGDGAVAEGEDTEVGTDAVTDGEAVERACLQVLSEAAPEPLHWTVVLDRALRGRLINPFEVRDVRKAVGRALALLARQGRLRKVAVGVYGLPEPVDGEAATSTE